MALRRSFSFSSKKGKTSEKPPEKKINEPVIDKFSEIATKMIEKELDLEKKCEVSVIHDLINLYSEAVEFFCQKNDLKYLDYQSRMQSMLKKPEVLLALQKENCKNPKEPVLKTETFESQVLHEKIVEEEPKTLEPVPLKIQDSVEQALEQSNEKVFKPQDPPLHQPKIISRSKNAQNEDPLLFEPRSPVLNVFASPPKFFHTKNSVSEGSPSSPVSPKPKNLEIIVERHSKNNKIHATRAAADFKSQDSALDRRLASRKKIQMTRSMSFSYSPPDLSGYSDVDIEEVSTNDKFECFVVDEHPDEHCDKYEKMLEEIMEKNFGERALKIAEIKLKYEGQINEISGMGEVMQMLVVQMKTHMQEEIDKVVQDYDQKRKEQIDKIRELY